MDRWEPGYPMIQREISNRWNKQLLYTPSGDSKTRLSWKSIDSKFSAKWTERFPASRLWASWMWCVLLPAMLEPLVQWNQSSQRRFSEDFWFSSHFRFLSFSQLFVIFLSTLVTVTVLASLHFWITLFVERFAISETFLKIQDPTAPLAIKAGQSASKIRSGFGVRFRFRKNRNETARRHVTCNWM